MAPLHSTGKQCDLPKCPTGIQGLDEVTNGGLPRGRPTLLCGGAGCGKTLMAMEFVVHGAIEFGEPGVFMTFEETPLDLAANVRSLGFDVDGLVRCGQLVIDSVHLERTEIQETGEYDLGGLFIRLDSAIGRVGAKRVALDTIEALFAGLSDSGILRAELRRLFRWLKEKGVTAVITGERGDGTLTRNGLEEYVSDCVILLDHRVSEQISTRRLRVVKYRGSTHGTNEYPFLIDENGISVLPITSLGLLHEASTERISSGIDQLDAMLGGQGYFRGASILVSGGAGTGKSSVAAHFVASACHRGEKCIIFAFEESPSQIIRNMRSIGIDLDRWIRDDLLRIEATRPTLLGLEGHLVALHKSIRDFEPRIVVLDPISNFLAAGAQSEAKAMVVRLIDFLKTGQITAMFTSLSPGDNANQQADIGVSSLMDTWLLLRNIESGVERVRWLDVLKSRGMSHSAQARRLVLTDHGVGLEDLKPGSVDRSKR